MNTPRAIELAVAGAIRANAVIGEGATIRAWQSLMADGSWNQMIDRTFPAVDIRCAPPRHGQDAFTYECDCAVRFATKTDDDRDRAFLSAMYGEGQRCINRIVHQYYHGGTGAEYEAFIAILNAEAGSEFVFGGIELADGYPPTDEAGVSVIGTALRIHFSGQD